MLLLVLILLRLLRRLLVLLCLRGGSRLLGPTFPCAAREAAQVLVQEHVSRTVLRARCLQVSCGADARKHTVTSPCAQDLRFDSMMC